MFEKIIIFYIQYFTYLKDKMICDFVCSRLDDTVENDKEKKEPDILTVENGIAPNHGFAFC
jgi:hypothetical protein